jgi:hypothetical protein
MGIAARVVAGIALWGGFVIAMLNWSNTDAATIGVVGGTVALGAIAGRWWALLVPVVPGVVLALATLVADPDDFYEGTPGSWALFVLIWMAGLVALVALGVAIHRTARRLLALRPR